MESPYNKRRITQITDICLPIATKRNSPKNAVVYKRVHKHIELHSQEHTKRNKCAEIPKGK